MDSNSNHSLPMMDHRVAVKDICTELRYAQSLLNHVCLYKSASWAAELLEDIANSGRRNRRESLLTGEAEKRWETDIHFCLGRELFDEMVNVCTRT